MEFQRSDQPKRCERCESTRWTRLEECECGVSGCNLCLAEYDFGVERETGYHDTGLVCEACLEKRNAEREADAEFREVA